MGLVDHLLAPNLCGADLGWLGEARGGLRGREGMGRWEETKAARWHTSRYPSQVLIAMGGAGILTSMSFSILGAPLPLLHSHPLTVAALAPPHLFRRCSQRAGQFQDRPKGASYPNPLPPTKRCRGKRHPRRQHVPKRLCLGDGCGQLRLLQLRHVERRQRKRQLFFDVIVACLHWLRLLLLVAIAFWIEASLVRSSHLQLRD